MGKFQKILLYKNFSCIISGFLIFFLCNFSYRHIRALLVSAFLIFYPAGVLVYLWRDTAMSRWDFILSTFNLRIIVKISISLTIYFIFIVDFFRKTFWERLDDYVYYLDVLGSAVSL